MTTPAETALDVALHRLVAFRASRGVDTVLTGADCVHEMALTIRLLAAADRAGGLVPRDWEADLDDMQARIAAARSHGEAVRLSEELAALVAEFRLYAATLREVADASVTRVTEVGW